MASRLPPRARGRQGRLADGGWRRQEAAASATAADPERAQAVRRRVAAQGRDSSERRSRDGFLSDADQPGSTSAAISPGGQVYAALATQQLDEERAIKSSLESRAIAPLSIAATALLGNVAALAGRIDISNLGLFARVFLGVAVALFVGALYFSLLILRPASHTHAQTAGLQGLILDDWLDPEDEAARRVALLTTTTLVEIRTRNSEKAENLHRVLVCEFLGLAAVAVAVISALISG
jgi:hypothetical protein